jgi:hypothetical protein
VPELREEIESVINEEGLSKESFAKMYKLDSFVKESGRMHAIRGCTSSLPNPVTDNLISIYI